MQVSPVRALAVPHSACDDAASLSPPRSPYACCPPADDARVWTASKPCSPAVATCDDDAPAQQLAELTMSAPCIPAGVQVAPDCEKASGHAAAAAAAPAAVSGCRLAAVNNFVLNKEEPQRSLGELVADMTEEISSGRKDLNRLYNLMMSYDFSGNEWKRYEFWDDRKKYTRNLIVSEPGVMCLMLLCWNPEKGSPIHNHAGSEGSIVEQQYVVRGQEGDASAECNWNKLVCTNIPPSDLTMTHRNVYTQGGCTFINDSLGVHAVENPFKEAAITLHCYIPGYDTCKSWSEDAQAKDKEKCVKIQQCHISFDSEQGERTHS